MGHIYFSFVQVMYIHWEKIHRKPHKIYWNKMDGLKLRLELKLVANFVFTSSEHKEM